MTLPATAQVAAQAKINLRLRVLAREDSGYHQIETLFLRIALADVVRVRRTPSERSLDVRGDVDLASIGPVEKNLAWRAAVAHAEASEWRGGFAIEIEKHIPIGGGLGGGSADAAGVIRVMNALTSAPVDAVTLAARLGADVPFLASDAAYALAWGRGERMLALTPPPERALVLAVPPFSVNTAEAYGWIDEVGAISELMAGMLQPEQLSDWSGLVRCARNDFQYVVHRRHPAVEELVSALGGSDTVLVRMSGSGSTLFAVVRPDGDPTAVAGRIRTEGVRVIQSRTSTHVEPIIPIE